MKPIQKLVPVETIIIPETIMKNTSVAIRIEGWLPDPAWIIKKETVDINKETRKVFVRLWGTRDPEIMAAQITKRYNKELQITFEMEGKWTIQCNDKNLEVTVE